MFRRDVLEGNKRRQKKRFDTSEQGFFSRIQFDWATIGVIASIIIGIAWFLWGSIQNVDKDVDNLTKRVNQMDDKFDAKLEKLAGDIGYIKGRIESMSPPTKSAKKDSGQQHSNISHQAKIK